MSLSRKIKEHFEKNRDFALASSLLLATNTIDKIVTFRGINQGTHYELNPVQNSMIQDYGAAATVTFGALFPFLLIPLSKKINDEMEKLSLNLGVGNFLVYSSGILSICSAINTTYSYFRI